MKLEKYMQYIKNRERKREKVATNEATWYFEMRRRREKMAIGSKTYLLSKKYIQWMIIRFLIIRFLKRSKKIRHDSRIEKFRCCDSKKLDGTALWCFSDWWRRGGAKEEWKGGGKSTAVRLEFQEFEAGKLAAIFDGWN